MDAAIAAAAAAGTNGVGEGSSSHDIEAAADAQQWLRGASMGDWAGALVTVAGLRMCDVARMTEAQLEQAGVLNEGDRARLLGAAAAAAAAAEAEEAAATPAEAVPTGPPAVHEEAQEGESNEMGLWLELLGLSEYEAGFAREGVDGFHSLQDLVSEEAEAETEAMCEALGLKLFERERLLRHAKEALAAFSESGGAASVLARARQILTRHVSTPATVAPVRVETVQVDRSRLLGTGSFADVYEGSCQVHGDESGTSPPWLVDSNTNCTTHTAFCSLACPCCAIWNY